MFSVSSPGIGGQRLRALRGLVMRMRLPVFIEGGRGCGGAGGRSAGPGAPATAAPIQAPRVAGVAYAWPGAGGGAGCREPGIRP